MNKSFKPSFFSMLAMRLEKKDFIYESYFKNSNVLDVGCGNGEFLKNDRERIEGLDANATVIDGLREAGYKVKAGDAGAIPYADGSFAGVHCRNVIEHLYPQEAYAMLKECARVLTPGGLLVLGTEMVTEKFWGTFGHTRPYPPGSIKKLLRSATREEFESIEELECLHIVYLGHFSRYKLLYFICSLIAYHLPFFRREYFMVLRKKSK